MDHVLDLTPVADTAAADSVFFIGNATVLLRFAGFTILTDPTFVHRHERVPLGYGMHTTRLTDPAISIDEVPPVDFVLLSHFHGDHFDQVAEERLDRSIPIVTTTEATKELEQRGFDTTIGLETWDTVSVGTGDHRLRVTAAPGRHGPGITDFALPQVMGSILTSDAARAPLYISGDTLVYDDLHEIPQRFPEIGTGLFHLGGTKVLGVMVTMDGEQGAEAVRIVNPRVAVPIHYDDYDVFTSPLQDFLDAAEAAGLGDRVHPIQRGETHPLR